MRLARQGAHAPPRFAPFLAAFAFRNFRLLWFGLLFGNLGTWMQFTALGYFVATLAPNAAQGAFFIGLLGAARALPVLLLSPIAGVVADRYPRRQILFATNGTTVVLSTILALVIFNHDAPLPIVMLLSGLQAATQSFDAPARQSWVPLMVPRDMVGNAIGLNSIAFNAPSIIGPPIAGLLIAGIGVAPCMAANAVLTLAVVIAVALMSPAPPSEVRRDSFRASILAGARFLIDHPVLRWVVLILVVASLTVRPYMFLLPAYAVHVLLTDARGLGWLMAASGLGAIGGALATAAFSPARRMWLFCGAATVMALGVGALGLTHIVDIAAAILVVIGIATMSFIGNANIMLQTLSPDDMRGRAISVYSMILLGLVPLGALLVGWIATLVDLHWVLLALGLLSAAIAAWIYAAHPAVRRV